MKRKCFSIAILMVCIVVLCFSGLTAVVAQEPETAPSAFESIKAVACIASSQGLNINLDGDQVGGMMKNEWLKYRLDFGTGKKVRGFSLELAREVVQNDSSEAIIKIGGTSVDDATPIGSIRTTPTGGWGTFEIQTANFKSVELEGIQDVYLYIGGSGVGNLRSFQFYETPCSPYSAINAFYYDSVSSIDEEKCSEENGISGVLKDSYALYKGIDFGSEAPLYFVPNYATGTYQEQPITGLLSVYLDSLDNDPIIQHNTEATGGWDKYYQYYLPLQNKEAITGKHDIYITFSADGTCNLKDFKFVKDVKDAYQTFQAIEYDEDYNDNPGGESIDIQGDAIGHTSNYVGVMFHGVNFDQKKLNGVTINYARGDTGDTNPRYAYIRLDSKHADPIATIEMPRTEGWGTFSDAVAEITEEVSGTHTVFLTFSAAGTGNIKSITFHYEATDIEVKEAVSITNDKDEPLDEEQLAQNSSFKAVVPVVNDTGSPKTVSVFIALYNADGTFQTVAAQTKSIETATDTVTVPLTLGKNIEAGQTLKVFVWNSQMAPVLFTPYALTAK